MPGLWGPFFFPFFLFFLFFLYFFSNFFFVCFPFYFFFLFFLFFPLLFLFPFFSPMKSELTLHRPPANYLPRKTFWIWWCWRFMITRGGGDGCRCIVLFAWSCIWKTHTYSKNMEMLCIFTKTSLTGLAGGGGGVGGREEENLKWAPGDPKGWEFALV